MVTGDWEDQKLRGKNDRGGRPKPAQSHLRGCWQHYPTLRVGGRLIVKERDNVRVPGKKKEKGYGGGEGKTHRGLQLGGQGRKLKPLKLSDIKRIQGKKEASQT